MSKNLQKVKDMLDGNYKHKIQSGYTPTEEKHEIGDKWTDSDGVQWEQKNGYRTKISKLANVGIFERQCKDCDTGILKPWDKDIYKWNNRCYYCQIDFEVDLKRQGKWEDWVKEMEGKIPARELLDIVLKTAKGG